MFCFSIRFERFKAVSISLKVVKYELKNRKFKRFESFFVEKKTFSSKGEELHVCVSYVLKKNFKKVLGSIFNLVVMHESGQNYLQFQNKH